MIEPRYPVYIPSKGRAGNLLTLRAFDRDGTPCRVVVEPSQVESYLPVVGSERLLVLPENGKGLTYARNWIWEHAIAEGHERHWQFDDDIREFIRAHKGHRLYCSSDVALAVLEDFVDQYENVALASLNSWFFVPVNRGFFEASPTPPFYLNHRCYTNFLVLNSLDNRFRGPYNEDADLSLQVLSCGWCTVLLNAFCINTPTTMTDAGGQTSIYVKDGRLRMARTLERAWPGVVTTSRRFGRPQHVVKGSWSYFDTGLKRKVAPPPVRAYGMRLVEKKPVQDPRLKQMLEEHRRDE